MKTHSKLPKLANFAGFPPAALRFLVMNTPIRKLHLGLALAGLALLEPAHAQPGNWAGWQDITSAFGGPTDRAVAAAAFQGSLYLFAKGNGADQAIYYNVFDGAGWGSRIEVPGGHRTD